MRDRHLRLVVLVAAALWSACHARAITAAKLEPAFAATFANLVHAEAPRVGVPAVDAAALHAGATCHRTGPGADAEGSGDWVCTVAWSSPGHPEPLHDTYELTVTPDGCYSAAADGALARVGGPTLTTREGTTIPNLLHAFDGCFDVSAPSVR